jgi:hypothetical protein
VISAQRMPRPRAVECHVRGYRQEIALEDATGLSRGDSRFPLPKLRCVTLHGTSPWHPENLASSVTLHGTSLWHMSKIFSQW